MNALRSSIIKTAFPLLRSTFRAMTSTTINSLRDPNTLSNYNKWVTRHTIADFAIDFKAQRLVGTVTLNLESLTDKASEEIILDTSFLDVKGISDNGLLGIVKTLLRHRKVSTIGAIDAEVTKQVTDRFHLTVREFFVRSLSGREELKGGALFSRLKADFKGYSLALFNTTRDSNG